MADIKKQLTVDIVSDVMCPWCFVGKRRFEKALSLLDPSIGVQVNWKPYQLDSTLPPEGKDRKQYLSDKFGGTANAERFYAQIKLAGDAEGIPFNFEAIAVSPNTFDAHRLILWAGQKGEGQQNNVVESLFKAYFIDGQNIGDRTILVDLGIKAGLDGPELEGKLRSEEGVIETRESASHAHQIGVTGVPCFIVEQKYGISGAQDPPTLANAMTKIAAESGDIGLKVDAG